jgi:hypothetical protein
MSSLEEFPGPSDLLISLPRPLSPIGFYKDHTGLQFASLLLWAPRNYCFVKYRYRKSLAQSSFILSLAQGKDTTEVQTRCHRGRYPAVKNMCLKNPYLCPHCLLWFSFVQRGAELPRPLFNPYGEISSRYPTMSMMVKGSRFQH